MSSSSAITNANPALKPANFADLSCLVIVVQERLAERSHRWWYARLCSVQRLAFRAQHDDQQQRKREPVYDEARGDERAGWRGAQKVRYDRTRQQGQQQSDA